MPPIVTPVLLTKVNLMTEQAWPKNQADIENNDVDAATLDTLVSHQDSATQNFIEKVTDTTKDYDVQVAWYDFCGSGAIDCNQDPCTTITGNGNDVKSKTYNVNGCIEDAFEVSENLFATTTLSVQDYIVKRQTRMIKNMLERLNDKAIAFLAANAGFNRGTQYPYAGGLTTIPSADYDMKLLPKLQLDMMVSKLKDGFGIDGSGLYLPYSYALQNGGNAEGKGDALRAKLLDINFDIIGMAKAGLSDRTFLVSPHAYAFVTKNYIQSGVPTFDPALDKLKYSITIPGYNLKVDVWHQRACEDGTRDRFKHVFLYKLHYDFLLNPAGCTIDGGAVTGIVEYKQAA